MPIDPHDTIQSARDTAHHSDGYAPDELDPLTPLGVVLLALGAGIVAGLLLLVGLSLLG